MVKTTDIKTITFSKDPWRPKNPKTYEVQIYGWDTETNGLFGQAFLLTKSTPYRTDSYSLHSFQDFINIIWNQSCRDSINFFFNLDFDFAAIAKFLGKKHLEEISKVGKTYYEDYEISWIPHKAFKISKKKNKRSHHGSVEFFDIMQYYNTNLKNAAKLVGEIKLDFDTSHVDFDRYQTDIEYHVKLETYAKQDALICRKLGERLHKAVNTFIPVYKYYSTASIAQEYFLSNINSKINLPPLKVQDFALKAYKGGRFELIRKGFFPRIFEIDINSAYPKEMSELILTDTETGYWTHTVTEHNQDAIYGIYEIETETYDYLLSPIIRKVNNLLLYPHGKHHVFVEKTELELILKMGFKVKILNGFEYFDTNPVKCFNFINKLYEMRQQLKKEGKDDLQYVLKIIMNSAYGKTVQLMPNYIFKEELSPELLEKIDELETNELFTDTGEIVTLVREGWKAGRMFHPVFGAKITANTRTNLLRTVHKYNLEKELVGFATDCIYLKRKPPEELLGNGLGAWKLEIEESEGLFVGNGVYSIRCKRSWNNCNIEDGVCKTHDKNHIRGFRSRISLFNELEKRFTITEKSKGLLFENTSPVKLKQGIRGGIMETTDKGNVEIGWEDICKFYNFKRVLDLNCDRKRNWAKVINNPQDLLDGEIESEPITITDMNIGDLKEYRPEVLV